MTALPMDFSRVLHKLAAPEALAVWDTVGTYIDGEWIESDGIPRQPVQAVVLGLGPRDLELVPEGERSGGGISITTQEELFFSDLLDESMGQDARQSYVEYKNRRYRVTGSALMHGNTNLRVYHALRSIR